MDNYLEDNEELAKVIQMSANEMRQEVFVALNLVDVFQGHKPII